jgi:hypothetical protein
LWSSGSHILELNVINLSTCSFIINVTQPTEYLGHTHDIIMQKTISDHVGYHGAKYWQHYIHFTENSVLYLRIFEVYVLRDILYLF